MNYLSYILFLCFDKDDISNVKRLVDRINKELGSSIEIGTDAIEPHEESAFPKIEQSEAVLVFLSETAKGSEYVKNCLDYANALGKRIFPIKIDRDSSGDTMPDLSDSDMDCFDTDDEEQFGKLVKQLKDILKPAGGNEVPNATLVHIYTDKVAKVCRYGKVLCVAIPGQDNTIRLGKGVHKLDFTSIGEAPESYSIPYEVKEYNGTQSLTINFKRRREQLTNGTGKTIHKQAETGTVLAKESIRKYAWGLLALVFFLFLVFYMFMASETIENEANEYVENVDGNESSLNKEQNTLAPKIDNNEYISLLDCPKEDEHLSIRLKDYSTIDIFYDGKLFQTLQNVDVFGGEEMKMLLAENDETTFFDANFDGYIDFIVGPISSHSSLIIWDNSQNKYVVAHGYLGEQRAPFLEPSSKSFFAVHSRCWFHRELRRFVINGAQMQLIEELTIVNEPAKYTDFFVNNKYTLKDSSDELIMSTGSISDLPESWKRVVLFYDSSNKDANNTNTKEIIDGQDEEKAISDFITKMFNNGSYDNNVFLESHCTKALLMKLYDAYEYEGGGYAFWLFSNGAQDDRYDDGDSRNVNRITKVVSLGDGWFMYEYYSSGWPGRNRIHATIKDGVVWMDDVQGNELDD